MNLYYNPWLKQENDDCIVLLIENSRFCAGKRLYNNRLWFRSREFTTLKGILQRNRLVGPEGFQYGKGSPCHGKDFISGD